MANLDLRWILLGFILILTLEGLAWGDTSAAKPKEKSTPPTAVKTTTLKSTTIKPTTIKEKVKPTNNSEEPLVNVAPLNETGIGLLQPSNNKGLLKRMLYVAVGLSALVAIYFIFKTIHTKRRKSKSKRYGVIHTAGDLEMQPLDRDDDDEDDMTVFDRKTRK